MSRLTHSQSANFGNSHDFRHSMEMKHAEEQEDDNPFKIPQEDVFVLRDREKQQKAELRSKLSKMKIWEKPAKVDKLLEEENDGVNEELRERSPTKKQLLASINKEKAFHPRRGEKENLADFIAKKRDMFLIQMSLDTKRQEIQKLEEKAGMKEDALRKSEMMLEEDAMRFDAFLKENDRKAHEAMKRADQETKEKQEKVLEIKKLNQEISKVENEMSKYEEQLNACRKYQRFLDDLTPVEWKEQQRKKREDRQRRKAALRANGDDEDDDEDDDSEPMYFQRPDQLLDIFAQLEERNLFLIQNVQETEEALEELKQKFEETQRQMEEKTNLLLNNINDLKSKIYQEQDKADNLKKRSKAGSVATHHQSLLMELSEKVKLVYTKCGFDADSHNDTLEMLRDIESWLEYLLNEMRQMPPEQVETAEKKKNSERRDRIRLQKKDEQKRLYEERLAKSTQRAKAEVVKRTGKQVMFRSPPIRKKVVKEETVQRDEEAEELKKFFT